MGLSEVELAQAAGTDSAALAEWESGRRSVPNVAAKVLTVLTEVVGAAALETVRLIEEGSRSGRIVTFSTDDAVKVATGGAITSVRVHRVCAGRAALAVPDAQVVRRLDGEEDRQAWMLCVAAALGMGLEQVLKYFDIRRRAGEFWLLGSRPAPEAVLSQVADIAAEAIVHVQELADLVDPDDPTVRVCTTDAHMGAHWPQHSDLPLVTHQVCAARAAVSAGADLVYMPS
ncbi:hypothetical protein [Gordonia effusa]|uniref:hypothetical protein n=1 Tax=Gordonia effusa TaxID=263908 RepID=UPI000303179A|nr:hypothetical protein [Gordonia effusa]